MPQVSRNKLSKKTEEKFLSTFHLILTKINKSEDMSTFLLSLLTTTEQIMLAKRLMMFVLIKEGYTDMELSRTVHVTRVTASRFRYFIESHGEGFEIAWKILEDEKLLEELKGFLSRLVTYTAMAAGGRVKATIL